jgi:hypothetical protein
VIELNIDYLRLVADPYAAPTAPLPPRSRAGLWWGLGIGCGCLSLLVAFVMFLAVWQFLEPGDVRAPGSRAPAPPSASSR